MADYLQSLDPRNLLVLEASLSFIISPFTSPSYNLPIFLFGVYAQDSAESNQALRLFTGLLTSSALFDIIWMARNHQAWPVRLIFLIILLLKAPTILAFIAALRQRGDQFSGLNIRGGNDLGGATVWSMPGGFTSLSGGRNGYQDVDAGRDVEAHPRPPAPAPAPAPPTQPQPQPQRVAPLPQAPGGYQTTNTPQP